MPMMSDLNEKMSKKEKDKLKVLFIVPSLSRAGAETQVVDLLNSMDNDKFDKYLFTFHKNIEQYNRLDLDNIKFYNKPRKNKLDFSIVKMIANVVDKEKIDIVHCTLTFSLLIGWLSTKLSREKPRLIAAIHTTTHRSAKEEVFEKVFFQWLLRRCDHVIFVCKKQAKHWKAKYPFLFEKNSVIYNGVDTSYFNPSAFHFQGKKLIKSLSIPDGAPVLCCIAGFRKEKGHDDLIEAFACLGDNVFLLLAGDGERKGRIELLVKKKGLENRVKFLGNVPDVRPVLAASDISVLASTAETFSIAMLESMSMGVSVVATDIGGISEAIIPGETGELVSPNDPDMLFRDLQRMIENPSRCRVMGKNCREHIAKKFTIEKMVYATESLLSFLMTFQKTVT